MANWNKILICFLIVNFVLLISQDSANAKRDRNKVDKIKDRALREEKRYLKKEGKKIKKFFSKKYEQLYISLCPDCYAKLLAASENCSSHYEKLNLSKDKIEKCREKSNEKLKRKRQKHFDNTIDDNLDNLKSYKEIYKLETKMLDCLFYQLKGQEKYRGLSKEEFKKEKNKLSQELFQQKIDCMKKQIQPTSLPETKKTLVNK